MKESFTLKTNSSHQTREFGTLLGRTLPGGTILELFGELGSGKTEFVKGLALGLEINRKITSPTFAILQSSQGRLTLHHVDLYRLTPREVKKLGLEEEWRGPQSHQWIYAVEWADRAEDFLFPMENPLIFILRLQFIILSKNSRNISIEGPKTWLKRLKTNLPKSLR